MTEKPPEGKRVGLHHSDSQIYGMQAKRLSPTDLEKWPGSAKVGLAFSGQTFMALVQRLRSSRQSKFRA
jgi:hypothetical protein